MTLVKNSANKLNLFFFEQNLDLLTVAEFFTNNRLLLSSASH